MATFSLCNNSFCETIRFVLRGGNFVPGGGNSLPGGGGGGGGAETSFATVADMLAHSGAEGDSYYVTETDSYYDVVHPDNLGSFKTLDQYANLCFDEDRIPSSETGLSNAAFGSTDLGTSVVFGSVLITSGTVTLTDEHLHGRVLGYGSGSNPEPGPNINHVTGNLKNYRTNVSDALDLGGQTTFDISWDRFAGSKVIVRRDFEGYKPIEFGCPEYDAGNLVNGAHMYNWVHIFAEQHPTRKVIHDGCVGYSSLMRFGKRVHTIGQAPGLYDIKVLGNDLGIQHQLTATFDTTIEHKLDCHATTFSCPAEYTGGEWTDFWQHGNMYENDVVFTSPADYIRPEMEDDPAYGPNALYMYFRHSQHHLGISWGRPGGKAAAAGQPHTNLWHGHCRFAYNLSHCIHTGYSTRFDNVFDVDAVLETIDPGPFNDGLHSIYHFDSPLIPTLRLGGYGIDAIFGQRSGGIGTLEWSGGEPVIYGARMFAHPVIQFRAGLNFDPEFPTFSIGTLNVDLRGTEMIDALFENGAPQSLDIGGGDIWIGSHNFRLVYFEGLGGSMAVSGTIGPASGKLNVHTNGTHTFMLFDYDIGHLVVRNVDLIGTGPDANGSDALCVFRNSSEPSGVQFAEVNACDLSDRVGALVQFRGAPQADLVIRNSTIEYGRLLAKHDNGQVGTITNSGVLNRQRLMIEDSTIQPFSIGDTDAMQVSDAVMRLRNVTDTAGRTSELTGSTDVVPAAAATVIDLPTTLIWAPRQMDITVTSDERGVLAHTAEARTNDGATAYAQPVLDGDDYRSPVVRITLTGGGATGTETLTIAYTLKVTPDAEFTYHRPYTITDDLIEEFTLPNGTVTDTDLRTLFELRDETGATVAGNLTFRTDGADDVVVSSEILGDGFTGRFTALSPGTDTFYFYATDDRGIEARIKLTITVV